MNEVFRRRNLPHLDIPGATYFVTSCLAGSIPALGLADLKRYQGQLAAQVPSPELSSEEWRIRCWKLLFARCDRWLDLEPAVRHLQAPELASLVVDSIYHFAGERYDLLAYVVMPSHFHWVFRPRDEWVESLGNEANDRTPRERIMHSLKLYTARESNLLLGQQGTFWQDESYDHCVRDTLELERIIRYVEDNPVKAELVDSTEYWLYSSARDRKQWKVPIGQALVRPR
jgi:type I restriction enzyme R subunit